MADCEPKNEPLGDPDITGIGASTALASGFDTCCDAEAKDLNVYGTGFGSDGRLRLVKFWHHRLRLLELVPFQCQD